MTILTTALAVATALAVTNSAPEKSVSPPNIILYVADDLGWGDLSIQGNDLIKTPNFDRIGEEGAQLSSFYAASNVCTPSRAGLLTGRYPIRSGMQHVVYPHSDWGLPADEFTIAEMLKEAGYRTGMVGKWHLGHRLQYWPTQQGFDDFFGVAYSNDMSPFSLYDGTSVLEVELDQRTLTKKYADHAISFVEDNADKPFFLYYAESFPHIPLYVPKAKEGQSEAGLYGDVVEHVDENFGRLLDAIERLGIADNTIVIVTSDNGPWFEGDPGVFRGRKGGTFEGGYRVPFLLRWPAQVKPGTKSDAMTMAIDLFPTLASVAGYTGAVHGEIDGKDVLSVWTGSNHSPHEYLFFFDGNNIAAVRDERFRLVLRDFYRMFPVPFEKYAGSLLFDLERDPKERFDFTEREGAVVQRLMAEVNKMRAVVEPLRIAPQSPSPPQDQDVHLGPLLSPDEPE